MRSTIVRCAANQEQKPVMQAPACGALARPAGRPLHARAVAQNHRLLVPVMLAEKVEITGAFIREDVGFEVEQDGHRDAGYSTGKTDQEALTAKRDTVDAKLSGAGINVRRDGSPGRRKLRSAV